MNRKRLTSALLVLLSLLYLLLFIPPNLTGSKDENMLACFRTDEYAQYTTLQRMTAAQPSLVQTVFNFIAYRHYYYGFPFFATSSLAIVPSRVSCQVLGCTYPVTWDMLVLRQLSPLFTLFSILLLIHLWTDFRSPLWSSLLFVILAAVPGAFWNNLWWHPDSLCMFFVVLSLFCLCKDNLRCSSWYLGAAVSCGMAAGTKVIGLFMFLTVATYLVLVWVANNKNHILVCTQGGLFILVMIVTIVLSNPQLLISSEREVVRLTLTDQVHEMSAGWGTYMPRGISAWYAGCIEAFYGRWWFLAIVLGLNILGLVLPSEKRLVSVLILTWWLPLSAYVVSSVAMKSSTYLLPTFLPLISCCGMVGVLLQGRTHIARGPVLAAIVVGVCVLLGSQLISYVHRDIGFYRDTAAREANSRSLAFFRAFGESYLSRVSAADRITVLKDVYIYVPASREFEVTIQWGGLNYSALDRNKPDLILLENSRIRHYLDPQVVERSVNKARAKENQQFYLDAHHEAIPGFVKVFSDSYGTAFVRGGSSVHTPKEAP